MGEAVMANLEPKDFAKRHELAIDAVFSKELAEEFLEGSEDPPYDRFRRQIALAIPDKKVTWVREFLAELDLIYDENAASGNWITELE